ncbi:hypothetical protein NY78_1513 [Desulfovibrio sp. TomC]|nr:hypothetical protein NY78_1513 [Desulfovibrio sp. TomC]
MGHDFVFSLLLPALRPPDLTVGPRSGWIAAPPFGGPGA